MSAAPTVLRTLAVTLALSAVGCIIDAPRRPNTEAVERNWPRVDVPRVDIPPPDMPDAGPLADPAFAGVGAFLQMDGSEVVPARPFVCGRAQYLGPFTGRLTPYTGRTIVETNNGVISCEGDRCYHWNASDGVSHVSWGRLQGVLMGGTVLGNGMFAGSRRGEHAKSLLILQTLDPAHGVRVLGDYRFPRQVHPEGDAEWDSVAASSHGVAAVIKTPIGFSRFFVGPADFSSLRMIEALPEGGPSVLRASGDRVMVLSNRDLYLYTFSTGRLEPIVVDRHIQQYASIDGDIIAWTDSRHDPGSYELPRNTEIYMMDLRDRVQVRLTHDPPEHPVIQGAPVVRGEWIFWRDWRYGDEPDRFDRLNQTALVGYHRRTRKTYLIERGNAPFGVESIEASERYLYFTCEAGTRVGHVGMFRLPIPDPADVTPLDRP